MADDLVKATVIDGIAATEDRDSQNEILRLSGADISRMVERGIFNDNHSSGLDKTLGRITFAKKVISEKDALGDSRVQLYWQKVQRPFLYVKGFLFDDAGHPAAKAAAAIMKEFKQQGQPLDLQMSVEGKVLKRDSFDRNVIRESMIQNVALTLSPANKNTGAQIIDSDIVAKAMRRCATMGPEVEREADLLFKNMGVVSAQALGASGFGDIVETPGILSGFREKMESGKSLVKMLGTAGGGTGKPSEAVGGQALVAESVARTIKNIGPGKKLKKGSVEHQHLLEALIKGMVKNSSDSGISYDRIVELAIAMVDKATD